jgi:NIMA-interacting peptidyl-prolyl cis-trans isomerase 1
VYCEVYEQEGIILERRHLGKARAHAFGRHAVWCDQVLPKISSISRQHAALVHTKQGPVFLDLFSQHGTTLNDKRMQPGHPYFLHDGDVVRFGGAGAFSKFKNTGRPKREAGAEITPIVPPAGYKIEEASGVEAGELASAAAAGASTAATAAASSASGAAAGDKRRHAGGDSGPRKDSRGEGGARQSRGGDASSGGRGSGLADPARDRIRCCHLLVKHTGSRRPASWRADPVTLSLAEARAKLQRLRDEITADNPSASVMEERLSLRAKVESDCSSAKHGGDLGFFEFKKMQPPFSGAAFKLRVGELSPIVETDSGVHIIFRKE